MTLVRAEWQRLFARRFTRIMIVIGFVALGLVTTGLALGSKTPTAAELAQAVEQADSDRAEVRLQRQLCEQAQRDGASDPELKYKYPPDCSQISDAYIDPDNYLPYHFHFTKQAPTLIKVFGGVLTMFAFVVGASFVGAEWSSGAMTNLLLWRPRRMQVLAAKLGTLLVGVTTISLGLGAAFVAMLYAVAQTRGRVGGITTSSMTSLGLTAGRSLALGLAAAVIGFGLASLGRHTATALGVAVSWALVFELGLRIVLLVTRVTWSDRYFLSTYVVAWLNQKLTIYDYNRCGPFRGQDGCDPAQLTITMGHSAIVVGAIMVALTGAAFLSMRQRDVT